MDTIIQQEKELQFTHFTHKKALNFGMIVLKMIEKDKLNPVRIRVKYCDDIVFQYLMDNKKGDLWLNLKENTVMKTGHSSLYVYNHQDQYQHLLDNKNYAICGGGFPLIENNKLKGVFVISGLNHEEDHNLIIKALRELEEEK